MYSKNKQKNKCVCIYNEIRLITMKTKMKKKRSNRYDRNRPKSQCDQIQHNFMLLA